MQADGIAGPVEGHDLQPQAVRAGLEAQLSRDRGGRPDEARRLADGDRGRAEVLAQDLFEIDPLELAGLQAHQAAEARGGQVHLAPARELAPDVDEPADADEAARVGPEVTRGLGICRDEGAVEEAGVHGQALAGRGIDEPIVPQRLHFLPMAPHERAAPVFADEVAVAHEQVERLLHRAEADIERCTEVPLARQAGTVRQRAGCNEPRDRATQPRALRRAR